MNSGSGGWVLQGSQHVSGRRISGFSLLSEANVSSAAPTACTLWVAAMSTGNFGSLAVRKLTDTAEQTPNSFGV